MLRLCFALCLVHGPSSCWRAHTHTPNESQRRPRVFVCASHRLVWLVTVYAASRSRLLCTALVGYEIGNGRRFSGYFRRTTDWMTTTMWDAIQARTSTASRLTQASQPNDLNPQQVVAVPIGGLPRSPAVLDSSRCCMPRSSRRPALLLPLALLLLGVLLTQVPYLNFVWPTIALGRECLRT